MDSPVQASYRLSAGGITHADPDSPAGETRGPDPVQCPVLAVAGVDLPDSFLDRLGPSEGTSR